MEWISDFKKNLNNPFNVKGFHILLNKNVINDVDPKLVENKYIDRQPSKKKIDIDDSIKAILQDKMSSNKACDSSINVDTSTFTYPSFEYGGGLTDEIGEIDRSRLETKARNLVKKMKLLENDFDLEMYLNIINKKPTKNILEEVVSRLERDVSLIEGTSYVENGILAIAGAVEEYLDGSKKIFGTGLNAKGLTDMMEVTLRDRKTETSELNRSISDKIGSSPTSKLAFDFLLNTVLVTQSNRRGTSELQRCIKMKKRIEKPIEKKN
jgi:hypothetical protein